MSSEGGWFDSTFGKFMDGQRLQRLGQCREIEQSLKACMEARQLQKAVDPNEDFGMEGIAPGIRMLRYYRWRDEESSSEEEEEEKLKTMPKPTIPSCAKQQHSVWGCRAISTACAVELIAMRDCFDQYDKDQVLAIADTNYDGSNDRLDRPIACREQQRILGACVAKNTAEMEQRIRRRNQVNA